LKKIINISLDSSDEENEENLSARSETGDSETDTANDIILKHS
jgi:hypothetical protein